MVTVMPLIGPFASALLCLGAFALGFATFLPYGMNNALSMAVASASLAAMSISLVLAARPRLTEPLFGGLDRMYQAHKWLGIAALGLMIVHDVVDPHFKKFVPKTQLGEFVSDLGEVAYYAFIGMILLSWFKRLPGLRIEIPYGLWRVSHKAMGVLFAVVFVHQLLTDKPMAQTAPLALLLNGLSIIGLLAYLYTEFAPRLNRKSYTVDTVAAARSATQIVIRPTKGSLRWQPGQFAFISAPAAGLGEAHPFTIASAPAQDGVMRFAIKNLGDWTGRLGSVLKPGQELIVEGPYGRFQPNSQRGDQIWIAGGVGITPFLAAASALPDDRRIHLFYCLEKRADAVGLDVLDRAMRDHPGFRYTLVESRQDGYLTAEKLAMHSAVPPKAASVFICGPEALRNAILTGLAAIGQQPRSVQYELFAFR